MRTTTLLKRNFIYYWRTNLAVILGVATAVAVLAGALLVGDSVRASLRDLFLLRLGNTSQVVSAAGFFREQLADDLQTHPQFATAFGAACPLIVLNAIVTHDESRRRGSGVQVYGVDERFWKFHGREGADQTPHNRELLLSPSLAQELGSKDGDAILVRVEKPSAIPLESLHGRKEDVGRTLRFSARGALPASALGEFSIRPQQGAVRAVFVPLRRLQRDLEQEGKANTILISEKGPGDAAKPELVERLLKDAFTLEDVGVKLRVLEAHHCLSLETEGAVVNDALAESARRAAAGLGAQTSSFLTYLANSIRAGGHEIPYSLVTAVDDNYSEGLSGEDPIMLNEWAARDLGAKPGDAVSLDYYLWQEPGRLLTQTAQFRLSSIAGLSGAAADRDLAPEYPGITGSESLADWDPPFPMDLGRIRPRDEEYWHQYRTTPKAFIRLAKGQELWGSRFGKLTSIRIFPGSGDLRSLHESYRQSLRPTLDPVRMGLSVYSAKAQGLAASRGATDFGEYFVYFSFFIVASALLLTGLFFKLGVEQRLREIGILRAIGFPAAKIRSLFLNEGAALAIAGSIVGLLGALAYGGLMMLGLRTWWVDAVGTTLLTLHISPLSLALGAAGGILAALACIVWTLRRLAPASPRSLLSGDWNVQRRGDGATGRGGEEETPRVFLYLPVAPSPRRPVSASHAAVAFSLLGLLLLLGSALHWVGQVAGFFGAGTLLLVALLCYQSAWLQGSKRKIIQGSGWWPVSRLGFRNATYRPGRSVLCIALIASATFIIVAVDAFRRDSQDVVLDKKSGSGGFSLLAESLLPLTQDLNTAEGRESLNLGLPDDAALAGVTFTRFRLRPGDDASCLNLYQPRNPKILAPGDDLIKSGRFAFQDSLARTPEEQANPWLLLQGEAAGGAAPVIADANSMTYVLHLKLGDEFVINQSSDHPIRLRLVGALKDSLFQGELLLSEKNFLRLFPDQEGYRFFLIDVPPEKAARVSAVLEERLSDFGFDVMPTNERLASFHRVENTYLSTFQTLGGLGLVLGTLGLATVLLRNVLERRRELALLRAVGYDSSDFVLMVVAENAWLLACGLLTGTACALLAIAPAFFSRGGHLPTGSLGVLLLIVVVTGLAASLVATVAALRSPLLPALRAE